MLRAIAERQVAMPDFLHIIHVEQEASPDDRSALTTVMDTDAERAYLLDLEQRLLETEKDEIEVWGRRRRWQAC